MRMTLTPVNEKRAGVSTFTVKPRSGHDFNSLHAKVYRLVSFFGWYSLIPQGFFQYLVNKSNGYPGVTTEESNNDVGLFCHLRIVPGC